MPRRQTSIDCNHLLNFKQHQSQKLYSSSSASSNKGRRNHKKQQYDPKKQAAERAERWTREKLNSSFYLHSSASHSFVVTRSKVEKEKGLEKPRYLRSYSHGGGGNSSENNDADSVVDWDMVRLVKVQVQLQNQTQAQISNGGMNHDQEALSTCAICLSSFVSPRITKCGHVYCYQCILRHFHVTESKREKKLHRPSDSVAKCPCCFTYIQLSELRPVLFTTVQSPNRVASGGSRGGASNQISMTFRKCHRKRNGMVPFLPYQLKPHIMSSSESHHRHSSNDKVTIRKREDPNDIPTIDNPDAPYCRFNYLDIQTYIQHLKSDLSSLQCEMKFVTDLYNSFPGSKSISIRSNMSSSKSNSSSVDITGNLDRYFITMAMEAVQVEHNLALSIVEEQTKLKNEQESQFLQIQRVKIVPYHYNDLENIHTGKRAKAISKEEISIAKVEDNAVDTTPTKSSPSASMNDSYDNDKNESSSKKPKRRPRANSMYLTPGTMYLDNDCVQFYQAVDGQLCFLCGFNIKCLAYEFMDKELSRDNSELLQQQEQDSKSRNSSNSNNNNSNNKNHKISNVKNNNHSNKSRNKLTHPRPPFPDFIQGQIVDVQTVHLTPDARRRMPFLSHLPLYIDVNLVELNLTQHLSHKTREHFKNELEQRKKKRQAQRNSERKAKKKAEKEEYYRIESLKKGMQRIDINDEFFHAVARPSSIEEDEKVAEGEDFGPSLSSLTSNAVPSQNISSSDQIHRSYGSVCASNGFFPKLDASNSTAFPSLSISASTAPSVQANDSNNEATKVQKMSPMPKSKKKSKVVLFSSGGRRGYSK